MQDDASDYRNIFAEIVKFGLQSFANHRIFWCCAE